MSYSNNVRRRLKPILFVKLDSNQFSRIMSWLDSVCEQPSVRVFFEKDDDGISRIGASAIGQNRGGPVDYVYSSALNTDELEIVWNTSEYPGKQTLLLDFDASKSALKDAIKENNKKDQGQLIVYQVDPPNDAGPSLNEGGHRYALGIEKGDNTSNYKTRVDAVSSVWTQSPVVRNNETSVIRIPNTLMIDLLDRSRKKARDLQMTIWCDTEAETNAYGFVLTNLTGNNSRVSTYNADPDIMESVFTFNVPIERVPGMLAFLHVFKNGTTRISYCDESITFANRFCSSGEQSMTFAHK